MIRPIARFVTHFVAAMVAALAVVFSVFAWQLSAGPIPLAFLMPYIQDALGQTNSPSQIEFSDPVLIWSEWDQLPDIRILKPRIMSADGTLSAVAPEISISLSLPALWHGMIAPGALKIIEPRVTLFRKAGNRFKLGMEGVGQAKILEAAHNAAEFLFSYLSERPNRTRAMRYIERIDIIRGNFEVVDEGLGTAWTIPNATVTITRNESGAGIDATLLVGVAEHRSEIGIRARYHGLKDFSKIRVDIADMRPEWIALELSGLDVLNAGHFPVSGTFELSFDGAAKLTEIAFNLEAGAGGLHLEQWFKDPMEIAGANIVGTYAIANESLLIDSAVIDLNGPRVTFDGIVEGFTRHPFIVANITATDFPVDDLARYWPIGPAPDVRAWITGNITGGIITEARAELRLKPGDLDLPRFPNAAVRASLEIKNITVNYYDPLPKVTNLNGSGTITGRHFDMRLWGGRSGSLMIREAGIKIADIGIRDDTTIAVRIEGRIDDALRFLAHPILDYPRKLGIEPDTVTGVMRGTLNFSFPITYQLEPKDILVTAKSMLTNIRAAGLFGDVDVGGGPLELALDDKSIDLVGPITLGGVAGKGEWHENFTDSALIKRRYAFTGRITDKQRLALGLPGGDYVAGPTDISVDVSERNDGNRSWRIVVGLNDAMLRIPELHWEKPAGVGGSFELRLRSDPTTPLVVESFNLAAGDLSAQGRADFDAESGLLHSLDLNRLTFGETNVRVALVVDENGGYRMTIEGPSLDLSPYIEDASGDLPDLIIAAGIERVITRDDQSFTAVKAKLRATGGQWEAMRIDGTLANNKSLAVSIRRNNGRRYFWMKSDDGGEVLRALGIFDDAAGGELTIRAVLDSNADGNGAIEGELRITDFTLRKVPVLARILTVATLTGVFDLLAGDGLPLSSLVVPFTKRGKQLDITNARAFGPAIGFTFKGRIDQEAGIADLDGTLVPAYALNSIFGNIPILGDLLVGEEDGGVFAMNYKLSGPLNNPVVSINPLSVLAPGILRDLFSADIENSDDPEKPPKKLDR